MSRPEAYKKIWCVCDNDTGIPLGQQPYYTLNQAVARYNRECLETARLFPKLGKRDIERMYNITNMKTGEIVL